MRYKCFACGNEFDSIQQLAAHKKQHQNSTTDSTGITCLGCGKTIPIDSSKANYSGPLICPNCRQTMKVVLEDGKVVTARFG